MLITNTEIPIFDLNNIKPGDAVRFRRAGEMTSRNGFITKIDEHTIEILARNTRPNGNSFFRIDAVDAAIGVWEIYWTTDFININYQPMADIGGG